MGQASAWAASAERPNDDSTCTNNWPGEELVGNAPTGNTMACSIFSLAAHYCLGLSRFFGMRLQEWWPFNLVRTWHVPLALFWYRRRSWRQEYSWYR